MILCGEELIGLERLAPLQERIYPDSADCGIIVQVDDERQNEQARIIVRRAVKEFLASGLLRSHASDDAYSTWTFFLPVEKDNGATQGYDIVVSWVKAKRAKSVLQWLSIDINRGVE